MPLVLSHVALKVNIITQRFRCLDWTKAAFCLRVVCAWTQICSDLMLQAAAGGQSSDPRYVVFIMNQLNVINLDYCFLIALLKKRGGGVLIWHAALQHLSIAVTQSHDLLHVFTLQHCADVKVVPALLGKVSLIFCADRRHYGHEK